MVRDCTFDGWEVGVSLFQDGLGLLDGLEGILFELGKGQAAIKDEF